MRPAAPARDKRSNSVVMLPEVDGYTILSKIGQIESFKNTPVIVITAKSRMSDLFVSNPNVKGFFSKPFDPKAIRAKVKELIG
jgi:CheY-like chemotaxis protein